MKQVLSQNRPHPGLTSSLLSIITFCILPLGVCFGIFGLVKSIKAKRLSIIILALIGILGSIGYFIFITTTKEFKAIWNI